jgi:hypothetical protein
LRISLQTDISRREVVYGEEIVLNFAGTESSRFRTAVLEDRTFARFRRP